MNKHWHNLTFKSSVWCKNKIVPSVYWRIMVLSNTHRIHMPCNHWCSSNWLTKIGNISTTKLKSNGDNGHPCLKPLPIRDFSPVDPLTKTYTVAHITHLWIHPIHLATKLILFRMKTRKSQSTQSQAFSKLILKTQPSPNHLIVSTTFDATVHPSNPNV